MDYKIMDLVPYKFIEDYSSDDEGAPMEMNKTVSKPVASMSICLSPTIKLEPTTPSPDLSRHSILPQQEMPRQCSTPAVTHSRKRREDMTEYEECIMESTRRCRDTNWSQLEKEILLEGVTTHKKIIENKSNSSIMHRQKEDSWKAIQADLQTSGYPRELSQVRDQWKRMKIQAKKSVSALKSSRKQTDRGPPPPQPSDMDYKIMDLVPYKFIEDYSSDDEGAPMEMNETVSKPVASTSICLSSTIKLEPTTPSPDLSRHSILPQRETPRQFSTPAVTHSRKRREDMTEYEEYIMESTRRCRDTNWSQIEKEILLEGVTTHKKIVENKSNSSIIHRQKEDSWKAIQADLQTSGYTRELSQVRDQWKRMKIQAKKSVSAFKSGRKQTGGGPPPPLPSEMVYKIMDLVSYKFTEDYSSDDCGAQMEMNETVSEPVASTSICLSPTIELGPTTSSPDLSRHSISQQRETPRQFSTPAVTHSRKRREDMTEYEECIMESTRRCRDTNWSQIEKEILLEGVTTHTKIIEDKRHSSIMLRQKEDSWKAIQADLQTSGYPRELSQVRDQWKRMKIQAKKSVSAFKSGRTQTGGGPPLPSEMVHRIMDLVSYKFTEDYSSDDCGAPMEMNETASEPVASTSMCLSPTTNSRKRRKAMTEYEERMLELNKERLWAQSNLKIKVEEIRLKNAELLNKKIEIQIKTEQIKLKIEEAKLRKCLNNF